MTEETELPEFWCRMACRATKGQDRIFAHWLSDSRKLVVGVADGVSSGDGASAAQWLAEAISQIVSEANDSLDINMLAARIREKLAAVPDSPNQPASQSTLSCGICDAEPNEDRGGFRFNFFAVGDSPIWRVVRIESSDNFNFQAHTVYSGPFPGELGRLYSYVSVGSREIVGKLHFGSVEIADDELLVIASDGIPDWQIFDHDQDKKYNADSPKIIEQAFQGTPLSDAYMAQLLEEYDSKRLLIDDDASILIIKRPTHQSPTLESKESPAISQSDENSPVIGSTAEQDFSVDPPTDLTKPVKRRRNKSKPKNKKPKGISTQKIRKNISQLPSID